MGVDGSTCWGRKARSVPDGWSGPIGHPSPRRDAVCGRFTGSGTASDGACGGRIAVKRPLDERCVVLLTRYHGGTRSVGLFWAERPRWTNGASQNVRRPRVTRPRWVCPAPDGDCRNQNIERPRGSGRCFLHICGGTGLYARETRETPVRTYAGGGRRRGTAQCMFHATCCVDTSGARTTEQQQNRPHTRRDPEGRDTRTAAPCPVPCSESCVGVRAFRIRRDACRRA